MKISKDWLNDFVEVSDLSAAEFTEIITTKVAEVDDVTIAAAPTDDAIVALVESVSPHKDKANLNIASVQIGTETRNVVCGADNIRQGMLTAYLAPGNKFTGEGGKDIEIEAREVGGVLSQGILVSERELGLTNSHNGIFELDSNLKSKPGEKLSTFIGHSDIILEIDNKSLTHRPDLWSHFGFARELSAILNRPLKISADEWADDNGKSKLLEKLSEKGESPFSTAIDADAAKRFIGVSIDGVSVTTSPLWMRRRLHSVGAGVRNLIVDLSNYVMNDIGQPNHTYDRAKLNGSVLQARFAKEGEILTSLDEVERKLSKDDIVIADESCAVALAGVIGGLESSVTETTTSLFLESANFDATAVRLMTKRHTVRTDASNRFEKNQSPFSAPLAIIRYASLLKEIQPSAKIVGKVSDAFNQRPTQVTVPISIPYIRERLDEKIDDKTIESILTSLQFSIKKTDKSGNAIATVPYYRATKDIEIEDDFVEEVGRIYGYENISENPPLIESRATISNKLKSIEDTVRDFLHGSSFNEIYNYSFASKEKNEQLGYPVADAVLLKNPVDQTSNYLRTTLVPNLLQTIENNKRYFRSLCLFEIGRGYEKKPYDSHANLKVREEFKNQAGFERRLLALGYTSGKTTKELSNSSTPAVSAGNDFYALADLIKRLGSLLGVEQISLIPISSDTGSTSRAGDLTTCRTWMHPFRAATIVAGEQQTPIGVIAQVHPQFISRGENESIVAEIDLEMLAEFATEIDSFQSITKFPDSLFEISVVMPSTDNFTEVETMITGSIDTNRLRRLDVISIYEGAPLKAGQKSVSIQLAFGADDRTLDADEVQTLQQCVMTAIANSSYELRS